MANYDLSSFERNGNTYTYKSEIPIASAETLGGIKVGENLSINPSTGVLSADGSSNVEDLDDLSDVTLSSPSNGQILKYNNGTWGNANELALGETASTAYAGDKGKANADAILAIKDGASIDSFADVESALSAVPSALGDLSDVSTTGVTSGQVLTYNGTGWEGTTPSAGTVTDVQIDSTSIVSGGVANISTMTGAGASAAGTKGLVPAPSAGDENKFLAGDGTWKTGGGSGASALDDLTDVTIVSAAPGDILKYDDANDVWINAPEVQEMTQTAYNALTPAQKADGSVRYVHDEPTVEFAETVLGTTYEYFDLSSSNATDLIVVVSNGSVAWAGFKFDLSTGESSVLTTAEITEAAAILQMQVSTNFTCTITQDSYTPSCVWVNNDWYNTSTIYLDATDMSNVGVRNSYYEYSTSLLYKTAGSDNNSIYLNNRNYGGGGGTSNLEAIELTQAEYDELTVEEKNDLTKIYFITDADGGGGQSRTVTPLYTSEITNNGEVTLLDSINNYDELMVIVNGTVNGMRTPFMIDVNYAINNCPYDTVVSAPHILFSIWDNAYNRMTVGQSLDKLYFYDFSQQKITAIYGVKYGGGSSNTEDVEVPSYIETTIYESSTDENTYNLSQPITDFDAIVIIAQYTGQVSNAIISRTFLVSEMIEYIGTDNRFELASDANYIWVGITDASTFTKKAQFDFKIIKFIGINYGLGKGIGKNAEIIPITNPTNTTSRTFTFAKTPKKISATYNSSDNWIGHWEFIWGDSYATLMTKAETLGLNASVGISSITYGSDGKSFTITGSNAFQALNSSGGYGQMYIDYGESNNQLQEDYSLTEQRIGTWIDNKPIYRIVLQPWRAGTLQTGYTYSNNILTTPLYNNISIDTIVDVKLLNHRTNNTDYTDVFVSSNALMGQAIVPNKNGQMFIGTIDYMGDVDIILEYTKVTT